MRLRVLCAIALVLLPACLESRLALQAGHGQLELYGKARSVDDVIADADTDERTRALLLETRRIVGFAARAGLEDKGNYRIFVDLDRPEVVWFLVASRPLAFEPRLWSFPVVGSFPYSGWFDELEMREIRERLLDDGWDVYVRPVHAYSTGGWLKDPVLSTMFSSGEDAFRSLSGTILHELVHANVLVPGQSVFNESLASFVGDVLTDQYLESRFGPVSLQVYLYRAERSWSRQVSARLHEVYLELDELYASDLPDPQKLARKDAITRALQLELGLSFQPNNASLLGFKTYNAGQDAFAELFAACGRSWPRFFAAVKSLRPEDFPEEQEEDIDPVVLRLTRGRCRPLRAGASERERHEGRHHGVALAVEDLVVAAHEEVRGAH